MNFEDIYTDLEKCGTLENQNAYREKGAKGDFFGVDKDTLQKIKSSVKISGKENGINHNIARKLWQTRNLDARLLACMIADKNEINRNEANQWVSVINYYELSDCFAKLIAQTRFGMDIMYLWIQSPNEYIKRTGFGILNYYAENDFTKSELYFKGFIQKIKQELQLTPDRAKESMLKCLISIGKRSKDLMQIVTEAAINIGTIETKDAKNKNQTINIEEFLKKNWK